jgi:hypothetical protein
VADKKDDDKTRPPLKEDEVLARLKSGPGEPPAGVTSFVGLLGRGAREGSWLLYLSLDMSRCIEVNADDVVHSEPLTPERSPFGSLGGTRLFVKKDAKVVTIQRASRTRDAQEAADEFDLDIRLGAGGVRALDICQGTEGNTTCAAECPGPGTGDANTCLTCVSCGDTCFRTCRDTCRTQCDQATCGTCAGQNTCGNATCDTCRTRCNQPTCGQATCQTCRTNCGTCETCQTQCGQRTCQTCRTDCGTCPGDTCQACTHVTCFRTCDACG